MFYHERRLLHRTALVPAVSILGARKKIRACDHFVPAKREIGKAFRRIQQNKKIVIHLDDARIEVIHMVGQW